MLLHHSSNFAHLKFHKLSERKSRNFYDFFLASPLMILVFRLYFYAVALITAFALFFGIFQPFGKRIMLRCLYYDDNDLSFLL